jgi:hypothetical protein
VLAHLEHMQPGQALAFAIGGDHLDRPPGRPPVVGRDRQEQGRRGVGGRLLDLVDAVDEGREIRP